MDNWLQNKNSHYRQKKSFDLVPISEAKIWFFFRNPETNIERRRPSFQNSELRVKIVFIGKLFLRLMLSLYHDVFVE